MDTLQVNPAFKSLIPPLSNEEYVGLEQNILADGKVRDAIVVWSGTVVDGHNRYEIAKKHGMSFDTMEKEFENENAAKLWIIDNQLGRRNVPPFVRIELAQLREPLIRAKAKEKQKTSTGGAKPQLVQVTAQAEPVKTRDEVAKIAKVSHDTLARAKKIMEKAPPEILQDLREGKRSIHETERELRVGSKTCESCGGEKPLSRFQNEGGKKCLDCKTYKQTVQAADSPDKNSKDNAVKTPQTQSNNKEMPADDADVDDFEDDEESGTADVPDAAGATTGEGFNSKTQPSNKPTAAQLTFGSPCTGSPEGSKEYREDLRQIREDVKKMAERSRTHKRTIEEFQQVFKANAEKLLTVLEHNIKFMDAGTWTDENNKQIARDLIDDVVRAITNFKEEFFNGNHGQLQHER